MCVNFRPIELEEDAEEGGDGGGNASVEDGIGVLYSSDEDSDVESEEHISSAEECDCDDNNGDDAMQN